MAATIVLVALWTLVHSTHAFYSPFRGPINYCSEQIKNLVENDNCTAQISVQVNALNSANILIPYEYSSLDFCLLDKKIPNDRDFSEKLGQLLIGEHLRTSAYNIKFVENITISRELCTKNYEEGNKDHKARLEFLRERIHESYMHQWVINNMPVTWCYSIMESDQPYCTTRFPIGCFVTPEGVRHEDCYLSNLLKEPGATYIFNHVHLIFSYHKGNKESQFTDGRIVRAQVQLASCKDFPCTPKSAPLKLPKPKDIQKGKPFKLTYSYTVEFIENENIQWASRWDYIPNSVPPSDGWSSIMILYTIITIFILSLFVGLIIYHSLLGSIKQTATVSNGVEDCGWKLVHERSRAAMLLSACVGSGLQILCTTFSVFLLACLGILSLPNSGAFVTALLVFYALFGYVAGYSSARIYNMIRGTYRKTNMLMTAFFVPGITFGVFFILNLFLWGAGSSAAIPFTTLLALLCLWFSVSLSLTCFGSFLGSRVAAPEHQIRTINQVSKEIHCLNRLGHFIFTSVTLGNLPFICVFIQIQYIFNGLWSDQGYYMFGSIMRAFLVLILSCAEIGLVLCYSYLHLGDYRWWWKSFFSTGTNAFAFFVFSVHYLIYKTSITGVISYILYLGFTIIITFHIFIVTGTIGFLSSLLFVHKIYSRSMPPKLLINYTRCQSKRNDQDKILPLPLYTSKVPIKLMLV